MRRRDFISLIGAAVAWPVAARAETKLPTIGFLGTASASAWEQYTGAFVRRLQEIGWADGRTVAIEYRWAEGRSERFAGFATEFVQRNVDVIVTGSAAVPALRQVNSVIPTVLALGTDPIGSGDGASLARPGGNITGLSLQNTETVGKRVELLRELIPGLRRLAVMANLGFSGAALEMERVQAAASAIDLELIMLDIRRADDIAPAFKAARGHVNAVYVITDPLVGASRVSINTLAAAAQLPTMHSLRLYVDVGGLISYGPNLSALFRRAADFVDKILHGTKPAEIPVEQPTKFELVINLTTARAIGLDIPESFLARADEVIE
jgi:putative tryptophan/tyrosine transport system substrate-binding protein